MHSINKDLKEARNLGEKTKKTNYAHYTPYLLCIPVVIFLVFLFLIPVGNQLLLSFYRFLPSGTAIGKFYEPTFTLENYIRFFTTAYLEGYFWPTIRIMLISTVIALILSYSVAYSIARSPLKLKKIYLAMTITAILIGPIAYVYTLLILLGKEGSINNFISFLGFGRITFIGSELGIIIGAIVGLLPYLILVLSSSLQNINPSCEDAARSLGANNTYTFVRITLPQSFPGIISAITLGLILSATMVQIPKVLGYGIVEMQGNLIYDAALLANNYPFSAAASMVLLIMALTINYGISYVLRLKIKWMR